MTLAELGNIVTTVEFTLGAMTALAFQRVIREIYGQALNVAGNRLGSGDDNQ